MNPTELHLRNNWIWHVCKMSSGCKLIPYDTEKKQYNANNIRNAVIWNNLIPSVHEQESHCIRGCQRSEVLFICTFRSNDTEGPVIARICQSCYDHVHHQQMPFRVDGGSRVIIKGPMEKKALRFRAIMKKWIKYKRKNTYGKELRRDAIREGSYGPEAPMIRHVAVIAYPSDLSDMFFRTLGFKRQLSISGSKPSYSILELNFLNRNFMRRAGLR
jgi:hypothetical protein